MSLPGCWRNSNFHLLTEPCLCKECCWGAGAFVYIACHRGISHSNYQGRIVKTLVQYTARLLLLNAFRITVSILQRAAHMWTQGTITQDLYLWLLVVICLTINPYRCVEVWRISITKASHPPTYSTDDEFLGHEGMLQTWSIMSVEQSDSDQMILLPLWVLLDLDVASVDTPVPAGQPVVTSQVPTQAVTSISANITNPLINGTNQGASGCPLAMSRWGSH